MVPIEPITGQRRYANGGSVSKGDRRLLYLGGGLLGIAWAVHDGIGLALPSGPVIEFVEHMSPIAALWLGLYHARTRQP